MERIEIYGGLNDDKTLARALANRRHDQRICFMVRTPDNPRIRLAVNLEGLSYIEPDVWKIIVRPIHRFGVRLVGTYNVKNQSGWLWPEKRTPIVTLGFELETRESLLAAKVVSLRQLLPLKELEICRLLVKPGDETNTPRLLDHDAISRFERMRNRLDDLGLAVAGARHTVAELRRSPLGRTRE